MTDQIQPSNVLLRLTGIEKHFGAVQAIAGVDLDVPAGQVTALIGDNGAGKSVLIKCIAGIHEPDAGEIFWEGQPVHIHSPRDAAALGIEVVYQDLALCDNLDVVQNMVLGRERLHNGVLDEDNMERAAAETLSALRVTTVRSVRQPVASLSGGQRQSVAVAKAVMWNSKLVILDEPTAALGVAQTKQVLQLVRRLADQGLAVIIISHNLNDIFAVADRFAILRLGKLVGVGTAAEFDPQAVVELMTLGRAIHHSHPQPTAPSAAYSRNPLTEAPVEEPSPGPIAGVSSSTPTRPAEPAAEAIHADESTLRGYFRAALLRLRAGQSGVLPVILGVIFIAVVFQFENANFLSAGNLVNLLVQGSVFMLIGMGAVFVLLLGEMDLSLGYVAGIGATVVTQLVQPDYAWPWWLAIAAALLVTAVLGLFEGTLVTRFRLPSFIVTLAGLLGFQGVMIQLLGTGGTIPIADDTINNLANGTLSPLGGWLLTGAAVVVFAIVTA
ncbi:MAG TPA: ATP-binding cassette domain-containing protein, partial [Bauldia sp.]|nr:ATP-binding cassette domain-containing protein [Bauldia sp.]